MSTIKYYLEDVTNIQNYSSLSINDDGNNVEELEGLLSRLVTLESMYLNMPNLKTFPSGLRRFVHLKSLRLVIPKIKEINQNCYQIP